MTSYWWAVMWTNLNTAEQAKRSVTSGGFKDESTKDKDYEPEQRSDHNWKPHLPSGGRISVSWTYHQSG